jgi:hypothetical protein
MSELGFIGLKKDYRIKILKTYTRGGRDYE